MEKLRKNIRLDPKDFDVYHVEPEVFNKIGTVLSSNQRRQVLTEAQKQEICARVGPRVRQAALQISDLIADLLVSKDYWGVLFTAESVMGLMLNSIHQVEVEYRKDVAQMN